MTDSKLHADLAESDLRADPTGSDLRAADADRERIAERLRAAAAEGRLTPDELEARLERALSARTYSELTVLVTDLPEPTPERGEGRRRRRDGRADRLRLYIPVMALLVAIWALTGAGYFWPIWPLLGWGFFVLGPPCRLGLCAHQRRSLRRAASF
jgi:hypothetical protein